MIIQSWKEYWDMKKPPSKIKVVWSTIRIVIKSLYDLFKEYREMKMKNRALDRAIKRIVAENKDT